MTTDGWMKFTRILEKEQVIRVEKLIVAISPAGPFLQLVTPFIDSITYGNYKEPVFHLPEGNTISEINYIHAASLRAFVAESNTNLQSLNIEHCALERLPPTLPKLGRIKVLTIKYGMLSALRLDMLIENQNLTKLDLSYNQIRQIFPTTGNSGRTLGIEKLMLTGNQLERLDMHVFASMVKLDVLHVSENRLFNVNVMIPVTFTKLTTFYIERNNIRTLDLRNLTLPSLSTISLGLNNLKQMPTLPKTLPKLEYISLEWNNLTQLDLSYFRPYQTLKHVYVMSNQISSVRLSSPVKLPIVSLVLTNNKITSFNITTFSLPNITSLNLAGNRLTVIPPGFERLPKTRLNMDRNPLTCDTLLPHKDALADGRLHKDLVSLSLACGTTSSFQVGEQMKACCDG